MKVWMIWVQHSDGVLSLFASADDDTVTENSSQWKQRIRDAWLEDGVESVRVAFVYVDFDAIKDSFDPVDAS